MPTDTQACSCCGEPGKVDNKGQCALCARGRHGDGCKRTPAPAPAPAPETKPAPAETKSPAAETPAATAETKEPEPTKAVEAEPVDEDDRPTQELRTVAQSGATRADTVTEEPQTTAVARREPSAVTQRGAVLTTLEEVWTFAGKVHASGLAPKGLDTREACFLAIEMGLELGMPPMMALSNIGVINGRPGPYGHAVKGMVEASGKMENYREFFEGEFPADSFKAVVISKRYGRDEARTEFSIADAKTAKLWGKTTKDGRDTPWVTNPKRMLLWRARQFNQHDNFPDVTRGFRTFEELQYDPGVIEAEVIPPPRRLSETKGEAPAS